MNTFAFEEEEAPESAGFGALLSQLPIILWQRKWFIFAPALLGIGAAVAAVILLPKKYEASATLLVQAPSLPREIIGMQVAGAVAQRIETIRQQIISRPALLAIIAKNDLYQEELKDRPLSEIVEDMRNSITMTPQDIDLGTGGSQDKTVSVRLAYSYSDPVKAQAVAQQLMEKVVEVDSTTNAEQLTGTVQFLTDQQKDLQEKIAKADEEISAFNKRYGGVIAANSLATVGGGGAAYDIQISNLQRDISDLEAQKRTLQTADTRDPAVVQAEAQLAAARSEYTENHPDVILAKQRLEQAKQLAKQNVARLPADELDQKIRQARNQIAQLQAAKSREAAQTSAIMARRAQAPAIEQQASDLEKRSATLYRQLEDVSNRLLAARASARAGEEQMGERLLVVDPPVVPDQLKSPNRLLILGLGAAGGLAFGLALALVLELLLRPIRDPQTLAQVMGAPPLSMIPVIGQAKSSSSQSRKSKKRRRYSFWRARNSQEAEDEYLSA